MLRVSGQDLSDCLPATCESHWVTTLATPVNGLLVDRGGEQRDDGHVRRLNLASAQADYGHWILNVVTNTMTNEETR
jgi:hypothetical protein